MRRTRIAAATALLAVVAGALWAVASASATHIGGATYNGTVTDQGPLSFTVSGDGSKINHLSTPEITVNGCTHDDVSGSIDIPITNHQFNYSTPAINFSGTFGGNQSASGTFRLSLGCDTGSLAWNATTTAPPSFSFGKVKQNKRKGTAKLTVEVPGPGDLELAKTKKVKADDEPVDAAGDEKLSIKPKGKAKKKLNTNGKAKVKAEVTFTPTGGTPTTQDKKIKLVKR